MDLLYAPKRQTPIGGLEEQEEEDQVEMRRIGQVDQVKEDKEKV